MSTVVQQTQWHRQQRAKINNQYSLIADRSKRFNRQQSVKRAVPSLYNKTLMAAIRTAVMRFWNKTFSKSKHAPKLKISVSSQSCYRIGIVYMYLTCLTIDNTCTYDSEHRDHAYLFQTYSALRQQLFLKIAFESFIIILFL